MSLSSDRSRQTGEAAVALPTSLSALVEEMAVRWPGLEIRHGDRAVLASELPNRIAQLAGGLEAWGVQPRDHVAIIMRNCIEWIETWFACAAVDAVIVPLNTRFALAETDYVVRHSESRWLVWRPTDSRLDSNALATMERAGLSLSGRAVVDGVPSGSQEVPFSMLQEGCPSATRENGAKLGMIQYTSGSTSFPKGAMLRNEALIRNAYGVGEAWRLDPHDRVLCSNPLFHCGGSVFAFLAAVTHGASVELMDTWRVEAAARIIKGRRITAFPAIDAAVRDLVAHAGATGDRFATLRLVSTAADGGLCQRAANYLECEVSNVYGLTECSPNVCVGDLSDPLEVRIDHIGRAQPGVEVEIRDLVTGKTVPPGETGEIVVRGWNVMDGYYNDPAASATAFTSDGFLHTGDLGALTEDGYLDFKGRAKLMIKSGGENIAIEEVEDALRSHPSVADAIVVPVPHERFGEVGFAFVRANTGAPRETPMLLLTCRDRLAGFKLPKYVEWVDDLPRTGSGKVDRVGLRKRAEELVIDAAYTEGA